MTGLGVGAIAPGLGYALFPYLPAMVWLLLFLSVLRIDPAQILRGFSELWGILGVVLVFQLALPLVIIGVAAMIGYQGPLLVGLILMAAAPSIMGSGNMCTMLGRPPDTALRILVVGTAILPLTVLPVFWLAPFLGGAGAILPVALKLLGTIAISGGLAVVIRLTVLPKLTERVAETVEGVSAITLAVFVVALMPQLGVLLRQAPQDALFWFAAVMIANIGLQLVVHFVLKGRVAPDRAVPIALIAGNRNIALFLVALPPEITAPILIWIGCYQVPMYLTPLLMRRFYAAPQVDLRG